MMNGLFNGILIINLDESKERWVDCGIELKKWDIVAERFAAVRVDLPEKKYERAVKGCRLSHLGCLTLAKSRRWQSVLILEDDFAVEDDFNAHFPKASSFLESAEWDMFYFGLFHHKRPIGTMWPGIERLTMGTATHAYAVHQRAYDGLIKLLEMNDCEISKIYAMYQAGSERCFSITPRLIYQRPGASTFFDGDFDYSCLRDPR